MAELSEFGMRGSAGNVASGPWVARDLFVAETSIKLDRNEAKLERLQEQVEALRGHVSSVREQAEQLERINGFAETLRNARDAKIDDIQRTQRDIRSRLDAIQGSPSAYNGLTHRSLEAIDARLNRLTDLELVVSGLKRTVYVSATLFGGSVVALIATAALRLA